MGPGELWWCHVTWTSNEGLKLMRHMGMSYIVQDGCQEVLENYYVTMDSEVVSVLRNHYLQHDVKIRDHMIITLLHVCLPRHLSSLFVPPSLPHTAFRLWHCWGVQVPRQLCRYPWLSPSGDSSVDHEVRMDAMWWYTVVKVVHGGCFHSQV